MSNPRNLAYTTSACFHHNVLWPSCRRATGLFVALALMLCQPATMLAQDVATTQPAATEGSSTTKPASTQPDPTGPIRMHFQDAPLTTVLAYLSQQAGLIIVQGEQVNGRVTVISRQGVSTEEAIGLLDTVLRESGYAAVYSGRTLKIVTLEQAKTSSIPVRSGNDPSKIQPSDRVITQIIPMKSVNAVKLKTDLASLFPESADIAANEGSNSLIITDSQSNIRRIVEIVHSLDQNLAGVSEVGVFQLTYADAANTAKLITDMFKSDDSQSSSNQRGGFAARMQMMMRGRRGGRPDSDQSQEDTSKQQRVIASSDQRTNSLVVSAPPELMTIISGLVKELDSNPAAEQTVFIYPLQNAKAENVADIVNNIFDENSGASMSTGTTARGNTGRSTRGRNTRTNTTAAASAPSSADMIGDVYCVADEDTNSLLVRTSSKNIDRVKKTLAELDRPIQQVLIKVLIAEVTHDETLDLGTEFSILNLRLNSSGTYTANYGAGTRSTGSIVTTLDGGLSATINALHRTGKMEVLSRPYILASDNQEASITVGQEVPFIRNTRTLDDGQTLNTIEYEDVGIILNVTPHVSPDGVVVMDVAPEISSVTDTTVPISETVSATVIAKRSAQTRVAIKDGQTIVIGGLMENRLTDVIRKVPLLGDIPLIGGLFRKTDKTKIKTELLIFLTPQVAKQPEELKRISDAEKAGSKNVNGAVESGAFKEHLRAMQATPTTRPADASEKESAN